MAYRIDDPYTQGIGTPNLGNMNLGLGNMNLGQVPVNNMQVAGGYDTPTAGDYGFNLIELDRLKRGGYNPGEVSNWENKEDVQSLIKSLEPQASAVNEYGYPLTASLSGAVPNRVSAIDQMANYNWSGFDDNIAKNMALANKMNTALDNTLQPVNTYDRGFQTGLDEKAAAEELQANQLNQNYGQFFRNRPVNERNFMSPINEGLGAIKTNVGQKMGEGWDFAKQLPGMAMGALGGMPGVAMNLLSKLGKPDTPYQKFQKQMFEDMGWQGESNKDPWGKNINSAFGDYDVTEQWGDLMGSKLGQNYGYADAFADGVLDDAELAKMQDLGLKGWQLNRAIGLSTAAKNAQNWKDKKEQEKIITNQMKNIDTGGGKTTTYTPPTKQGTTGSWTPGGTYQGVKSSPKGYSARSHSGGQYGGQHHWARGGRGGYANGGLASLFTRRG